MNEFWQETLAELESAAKSLKVDPDDVHSKVEYLRRDWKELIDSGRPRIEAIDHANARLVGGLIELVRQIAVAHAGCRRGKQCATCDPLRRAVALTVAFLRHHEER